MAEAAPVTEIPGFTRPVLVAMWLGFWLLMIAVAVQDYMRSGRTALWQPVLWESSSALMVTLLLALQLRYVRPADRWLARPVDWFLRYFAWLPLFWIVFPTLTFGLRHAVYALFGQRYHHEPWPDVYLYEALKLTLFYGLAALIVFGLRSFAAWSRERERLTVLAGSLKEAQLAQLAQQIQPHFLFNTLNLVSAVMHTDLERADRLLAQLGQLLRASLQQSQASTVALADEVELLRAYAEIMRERFSDRVQLELSVDPGALGCRIPPMTLQPLLENVFKHTVEHEPRLTRITLEIAREAGMLRVVIRDDRGQLPPAPRDGVGLGSVRVRLAALYGDRARLELAGEAGGGVRVGLEFPCTPA